MSHTLNISLLIPNKLIDVNDDDNKEMDDGEVVKPPLKADIPDLLKPTRQAQANGCDEELTLEAINDIAKACIKLISANQLRLAGRIEHIVRKIVGIEVLQPCMDEAAEEATLEEALMDALNAADDPPESEGDGKGKGKGKSKRIEPLLHIAVKRAAQRAQK